MLASHAIMETTLIVWPNVAPAIIPDKERDPHGQDHRAFPRRGCQTFPTKWVYLFSEGNATMRDLLGGKGAGVAEMTNAGLPVPPGFTITTEACNEYYARRQALPRRPVGPGAGRAARRRGADRQEARRRRESAARLGALRREVLDARHDGHRAQPRPERRDGARA